jgi:hypothetical protein
MSRDAYDDELVVKMVSDGAASSICPHSGILKSSPRAPPPRPATRECLGNSARRSDHANRAGATVPNDAWQRLRRVRHRGLRLLGTGVVPPGGAAAGREHQRDAAVQRPAPNTATGRSRISSNVCAYDVSFRSSPGRADSGQPGQRLPQIGHRL